MFTPGPWEIKKCPTEHDDLFEWSVNQAQPDPDFNIVCGVVCNIDSEADARLIAAAPLGYNLAERIVAMADDAYLAATLDGLRL